MASVILGDLNDYIEPSQACVNPLFVSVDAPSEEEQKTKNTKGIAKISLDSGIFSGLSDGAQKPDLIKSAGAKKTATVSLNDCLACSGCVTSAETVLISQQSAGEFLSTLQSKQHRRFVVSLSPQSRASIAAHFDIPLVKAHQFIAKYFKGLGVHEVLDTTASANLALMETRAEFIARFQNQKPLKWQPPPFSTAQSSAKTAYVDMDESGGRALETDPYTVAPMLTSACPGWVCYAEKTQPNVLPYISTAKSPQQIMGTLVKHILYRSWGMLATEIYHTAVMPCYDKKLEASRKDFYDETADCNDVDCVLSTDELLKMIQESGVAFDEEKDDGSASGAKRQRVDLDAKGDSAESSASRDSADESSSSSTSSSSSDGGGGGDSSSHDSPGDGTAAAAAADIRSSAGDAGDASDAAAGGPGVDVESMLTCWSDDAAKLIGAVEANAGSGGYLEHVFRHAAKTLYGVEVEGPLTYHAGRNNDFKEVFLEVGGEKVLRFALAYGFRNIQTIITKIKRGKCPYQFVEIMACPSGCVNGGGQIRAANTNDPTAAKALVEAVNNVFHERQVQQPQDADMCRQLYPKHFGGEPFSAEAKEFLHTRYHAVPKMELTQPLGIKWVQDGFQAQAHIRTTAEAAGVGFGRPFF